MSIEEMRQNRLKFLHKLYEITGGRGRAWLTTIEDVGKQLGFDRELSWNVARYLAGEQLLEIKTMNGTIGLTHPGVKAVEDALAPPSAQPSISAAFEQVSTSRETMKVFVSHSSGDKTIATEFVELLRAALLLPAKEIRCTSVDGYKLPAGTKSDEQLRREVFEAETFVALLSPTSIKSIYVMFELGARWASNRHLAPVMVSGLDPGFLKPPLSAIHACNATSEGDVYQLVYTLADTLKLNAEKPPAYFKTLHAFMEAAKSVSQPESDNGQLQKTLTTDQAQIGAGEISVIRILASAGEAVGERELVVFLNKPITEIKFYLGTLDKRGLAHCEGAVPNWGNMWHLTEEGNAFAVKQSLIGAPPPGFPRPRRGPFRA